MAAITNYNTLIAEVKAWCARSDSTFSARMPVLVELAEDRIYNGHGDNPADPLWSPPLRTRAMETTATVAMTSGAGTLPDGILAMRKITRANDEQGLTGVSPAEYDRLNAQANGSGLPVFYTVEGATSLKIVPAWSGNLTILYYRRLANISPDNQSNDLITANGLAYFQATMFEAFSFMQEPELAVGWLAKYRALVQGINMAEQSARTGASPQRMRIRAIW